jgi:hypothetical protein
LWGESTTKARRVVDNLFNRCLIKFSEQDRGYFLHPVMREEAVSRLKDEHSEWTEEGQEANRKAAEFFKDTLSEIKTTEDALIGFEVIYHYLEANDYIKSAAVIFELKSNAVGDSFDNFGFVCWRLGFSKQIITAI